MRKFHSSPISLKKYFDVNISKKEASTPVCVPYSISLNLKRRPSELIPKLCPHGPFRYSQLVDNAPALHRFRESSVYWNQMAEPVAILEIKKGPNQACYVSLPEWVDLSLSIGDLKGTKVDFWHGREKVLLENKTESNVFGSVISSHELIKQVQDNSPQSFLHVSCVDPTHPLQSRQWGFITRRIASSVKFLSEGLSLPIRLEGVGYRASIESLNLKDTKGKKDALMFEDWIRRWMHMITTRPLRNYIAENYADSSWAKMARLSSWIRPSVSLYFQSSLLKQNLQYMENPKTIPSYWIQDESKIPPLPKKLVLKLGFTHDVEIIVPPFVDISMPNPTKIILQGHEFNFLNEFANEIRKYRVPEPYKGKGVFVGNETVVLKQKKLK